VVVIYNMPAHQVQQIPISRGYLRDALGLHNSNARIYLYQGLLTRGRGIDLLLEVFKQMDDLTHLVFMGDGPMQTDIERAAIASSNIHHLPAVEPARVLEFTVDADLGLSLIENVCLSYYYCLPNKIFEYAACGVPCLVSDFPEMRAFVEQMGAGWAIRPNVEDISRCLRLLDKATVEDVKQRMRDVGRLPDWASQEPTLLRMYESMGFVEAKEL
jgi:glycosyltransferase involved in cell wall biosynthesis